MLNRNLERQQRANEEDRSSAQAVEVTAIYLDGNPKVDVRPLLKTRSVGFDGEEIFTEALEIKEIPYAFPLTGDFASFVPPKVGQQGFLINTRHEIGEVPNQEHKTARVRDASSGFFVPSGILDDTKEFEGNEAWAELRSIKARIAIAEDKVHLETSGADLILDGNGFDVLQGGLSLISAIKELSAHLAAVEAALSALTGAPLGGHAHQIDAWIQATPPQRKESGTV